MTNEEIFRSQWLRLKEEAIEKMNHSEKNGSMVSFTELNKFYQGRLVRWEIVSRAEGRWLDEQEIEKKKEFLKKLHSVSLKEIPPERGSGMTSVKGGAIGGGIGIILMVAEGVLRQENGFGWLPRIICVLLCAIVPYILLSNQQKTKLRTATEKAKKHYIAQIEKTGDELADIWR